MNEIMIAETIAGLFLCVSLVSQFSDKARSSCLRWLKCLSIANLIFLMSDLMAYASDWQSFPVWATYLVNYMSFTMGSAALVCHAGYCCAYIREFEPLGGWFFRIPAAAMTAGIAIITASFCTGRIFTYVDGVPTVVGGIPGVVSLIQVGILVYLPALAFRKRAAVGIRSVLMLGLYSVFLISTITVAAFTGQDYSVVASALSVVMIATRMQRDLNEINLRRANDILSASFAFTNYFIETFVSTYSVNLRTREYKACRRTPELDREYPILSDYTKSLGQYIARDVHPDDRDALAAFIQPENLKSLLEKKPVTTHSFRDISGGTEKMYGLRVIRGADGDSVAMAFADLTDDVRREQEHMRKIQEAQAMERANKAKSYFFSMVSHDIRTPLNAIIGYAELLKLGLPDETKRKEAVDSVLVSGHTLLELVNDVLDLSKLEAGKMEIFPEPVDVARLVEEVARSFRASIGRSPVEIRTEMPPMPRLRLDPHRVRQILFNLVGNAVKFTEKGSVAIRASFGGGKLRLEVADTGCGISEDDQRRIAQPYVQVGSVANRGKGTGLGLAICRQLIARMGGEIELQSVPGKGTTFIVSIPTTEDASDSARRDRLSDTQRLSSVVEGGRPSYGRVLVVDDQLMNRMVLKTMLTRFGISDVETAEDGKEALKRLHSTERPFDLVLTDIWMPEMDGEDLVREIRKDAAWKTLPVYAVTADVEAQKGYAAMGFTGILLKPITLEKLKEILG